MQDNITNAHRLIGETIREPGDERRGRIVGVDQSRPVPVIFVIWHEQAGIQRVELTREELCQLAEACGRENRAGEPPDTEDGAGRSDVSSETGATFTPEFSQRRAGSR